MIDLTDWVHSFAGAVHFASALTGMLSGVFILLGIKGTKRHRQIGYLFVISVILVNLSALFIYDFNQGSVSVFHFLIPVSLFFLGFGFIPMLGSRKANALNRHIIGMNGAVYGLWAAGATEFFVREMAIGLSSSELIAYSFAISLPFAVAITASIIYFRRKFLSTP